MRLPAVLQALTARARFSLALAWRWWAGEMAALVPKKAGQDTRWQPGMPLPKVAAIDIAVPEGQAFVRRIDLPVAAFGRMRDSLALQIGRITPFQAGDACWDARMIGRSPRPGQFVAELVVMPRAMISDLADRLEGAGSRARSVSVVHDGHRYELLESARRGHLTRWRIRLGAVGLFVLSIVALHWAWSDRLDREAQQAREAADALRPAAAQAAERRRLQAAAGLPARLAAEAATHSSSALLRELTALLPDDVQLIELRRDGAEVDIRGFAKDAPRLLPLIEHAEAFEAARFTTSVSRSPADPRDVFAIHFRYVGAAP